MLLVFLALGGCGESFLSGSDAGSENLGSNSGNSSSAACGNGVIEPGEQCDGVNFNGEACQTQGFDGGILSCTNACQLNVGGCYVAGGAQRLAFQDFETDGWRSEFTGQSHWEENITRTSNDPFAGSHALRWNQDSSRVDPITGLQGIGNSLLDWRGGVNLVQETPHEMFFRMRYRHDDYHSEATEENAARKLFYLVDKAHNVGAMYMSRQNGTLSPKISYYNGGYTSNWANENWGYTSMYLSHPDVRPSTDGEWRTVAMYFNYDENYFMVWMDGNLIQPSNDTYRTLYPEDAAAGRIRWDPDLELHYKGVQIMYFAASRDLLNAQDQTGYSAGVQIDDLEFWNGMPSGMELR